MKRTPLRRKTEIRKRRSKPRRGALSREEKHSIKQAIYDRAGGQCELRLSPQCIRGVLPFDGPDPWSHAHLVHLKSRGAGGDWSAGNLRNGCWHCHLVSMHTKGIKSE